MRITHARPGSRRGRAQYSNKQQHARTMSDRCPWDASGLSRQGPASRRVAATSAQRCPLCNHSTPPAPLLGSRGARACCGARSRGVKLTCVRAARNSGAARSGTQHSCAGADCARPCGCHPSSRHARRRIGVSSSRRAASACGCVCLQRSAAWRGRGLVVVHVCNADLALSCRVHVCFCTRAHFSLSSLPAVPFPCAGRREGASAAPERAAGARAKGCVPRRSLCVFALGACEGPCLAGPASRILPTHGRVRTHACAATYAAPLCRTEPQGRLSRARGLSRHGSAGATAAALW
jgi:hypothetical protein